MKIINIQLTDLKPAEKFLLSFPLHPELYLELGEKFAPLPLLIINRQNEIVSGIDFFRYLESQSISEIPVVQIDVPDKDALFLAYNWKDRFTGLNLYEKLVFIKRIIPLAEPPEIYARTGLDISINPDLLKKLDMLLSTVFRDALIAEHIDIKTGLKLCEFRPDDCETVLRLFVREPFSSSHRLKILEMAEEIIFRDKCPLADIFEKLRIDEALETERPQKKIIDALFTYRYPVYTEAEENWQKEIKSLNLPDNVRVTHFPFFEKKQVEVTLQVKDTGELKELLEKITAKRS